MRSFDDYGNALIDGAIRDRFAIQLGHVGDFSNGALLWRGRKLLQYIIAAFPLSGESLAVAAGSTSPQTVVSTHTNGLNNQFAYPAFRITLQATSAGGPGRAELTLNYRTQSGAVTNDTCQVQVNGVSETRLYAITGNPADGWWQPSPAFVNPVVTLTDSGTDTVTARAADTFAVAFAPTTYTLSVRPISPRIGSLMREFLQAYHLWGV